jgi:hypothetical protein
MIMQICLQLARGTITVHCPPGERPPQLAGEALKPHTPSGSSAPSVSCSPRQPRHHQHSSSNEGLLLRLVATVVVQAATAASNVL